MTKKETVKRRLTTDDQSISYTEFSYMLMQAYDFYKLFTTQNCLLQIAGSDQWGNIVTGIELIRKKTDKEAYGVTSNLILDATGKKFGKSEGNALWLDPEKNHPLVIYQYFMNTHDEDIEKYLKLFTLLSFEDITKILETHVQDPSMRYGQSQLAYYITQTIFSKKSAQHARDITIFLFQSDDEERKQQLQNMDKETIQALNKATGNIQYQDTKPLRFLDACTLSGLTNSNAEAKKLMKQGSLYLHDKKITDIQYEISDADWVNNIILLRKGKKHRKSILLSRTS